MVLATAPIAGIILISHTGSAPLPARHDLRAQTQARGRLGRRAKKITAHRHQGDSYSIVDFHSSQEPAGQSHPSIPLRAAPLGLIGRGCEWAHPRSESTRPRAGCPQVATAFRRHRPASWGRGNRPGLARGEGTMIPSGKGLSTSRSHWISQHLLGRFLRKLLVSKN